MKTPVIKNDTNTLYWLIIIGLWIMGLILGSCALTGCGGPDFVLDVPDAENNPEASVEAPDAADAGPDHVVGIPHPDAGRNDASDATPPDGSSVQDGAVQDSWTAEAGCTPWPPSTADCTPSGATSGLTYSIPAQYCVWLYDAALSPPATPVIMAAPAACACGYNTACLGDPCPSGSSYYAGGLFADDAGASRVVCRMNGDGG
jgi:hypothetical protein